MVYAWVNVSHCQPPTDGKYLVATSRGNRVFPAYYAENLEAADPIAFQGQKRPGWWNEDEMAILQYRDGEITHWMPWPRHPLQD